MITLEFGTHILCVCSFRYMCLAMQISETVNNGSEKEDMKPRQAHK